MTEGKQPEDLLEGPVDYEKTVEMFQRALIHTLRKHSISGSFLDYWVPDSDPVLGIAGMVDSAAIAGLNEIDIEFARTTVPEDRIEELKFALAKTCSATLTPKGGRILIRATDLGKGGGIGAAPPKVRAGGAYWQAEDSSTSVEEGDAAGWDDDRLPELSDIHPLLRARLADAAKAGIEDGKGRALQRDEIEVSGAEDGSSLGFYVDTGTNTVRHAFATGGQTPATRAVLGLFCRAAEGVPIQEAADHVALKVMENLVDEEQGPPVAGILLPANAGEPFRVAARLARKAYDAYRQTRGIGEEENFYTAPPADRWSGLTSAARLEAIATPLNGFLQSEGLYPDDMEILRLEKNKSGFETRVVIAFSDRVAVVDKPQLMRGLEARMRRDVERELELVADRVKDTSPLRRLS